MTFHACGQKEREERTGARSQRPPGGQLELALYHECPAGHAWHVPVVIVASAPCNCVAQA